MKRPQVLSDIDLAQRLAKLYWENANFTKQDVLEVIDILEKLSYKAKLEELMKCQHYSNCELLMTGVVSVAKVNSYEGGKNPVKTILDMIKPEHRLKVVSASKPDVCSALHRACMRNDYPAIKTIFDMVTDRDDRIELMSILRPTGENTIHIAAKHCKDAVRYLLNCLPAHLVFEFLKTENKSGRTILEMSLGNKDGHEATLHIISFLRNAPHLSAAGTQQCQSNNAQRPIKEMH